jgi:hypothetical protein
MGANRVAGALRMAATSLQRTRTALGAAFRRIARHKGASVAIFATARRLAQLVYRVTAVLLPAGPLDSWMAAHRLQSQ